MAALCMTDCSATWGAAGNSLPILSNVPIPQGVVKYFHPCCARHSLEHLLHLGVELVLDLQAATEPLRCRQMGVKDSPSINAALEGRAASHMSCFMHCLLLPQ